MLERARATRERELGADHPDTLANLNNLAAAYQTARRTAEAILLLEQIRDAVVKKLGRDHPHVLATLNSLAVAYTAAGKPSEALPLHEQAAAGVAKRRFQHAQAAAIVNNTVFAYEKAGQLDRAEGWRRQWLAVVKERSGAESPAYAGALADLGVNLLRQKKWADAEPFLRECLVISEKAQPDDWQTFNAMFRLGGALVGQKKFAEAEPLLRKGYEGMKQRKNTMPPQFAARLPEALDPLIELYIAMGKPDEAAKWRAERAKYPK